MDIKAPVSSLNNRQRAFLLIAILADRSNAQNLIPFLNSDDQVVVGPALSRLLIKNKEEKKQIVLDELKRLLMEAHRSFLSEIHPDWIVKSLEGESGRVIATILRYLPSELAYAVLENLPEEKLKTLPPINQTFEIDPELAGVLKKKFEEKFIPPGILSASSKRLTFDTIPLLSPLKLQLLFKEVGMREVAMALSTLNESTVDEILQRMSAREARVLKQRLLTKEKILSERLKQAQGHLVSLDLQKKDPENLLMEAGFFVYSKAVTPNQSTGVRIIQQKFSMGLASLLDHYIAKNLPLNSPQSARRYQKEILEAVSSVEADHPKTAVYS